MRLKNGGPVFAVVALLFVTGCGKDDPSEYRHYSTANLKSSSDNSEVTPPKPPIKPAQAKLNKIGKATPKAMGDWTDGMPGAIGFASRVILSETFRLNSEHWLTPSIGAGATLTLVKSVTQPVAKKAKKPREVKILVKENSFRTEGPEGAVRVTYDDLDLLKVINMDPVTPDAPEKMPDWLKKLSGKRIRIRGYMSPAFRQTGLEGFLMGRDNKACCFPGRAKIYDLFPVRLRKGVTTDYIQNRPFDVVGIFEIKTWVEDDEILQIYQISDAIVVQ